MKRITEMQKRCIVGLFTSGTPITCLADAWYVDAQNIEDIVRTAMKMMQTEDGQS